MSVDLKSIRHHIELLAKAYPHDDEVAILLELTEGVPMI